MAAYTAFSMADMASPASGRLDKMPPKPIGTSSKGSKRLTMAR
ncbi:Uncharacterised protein [Vibrio cholerae]|nr:Uncharacterised protein [Vibrio cholerae]CSI56077.1 Uncharacterised protein [Vibrio cholerae]